MDSGVSVEQESSMCLPERNPQTHLGVDHIVLVTSCIPVTCSHFTPERSDLNMKKFRDSALLGLSKNFGRTLRNYVTEKRQKCGIL